MVINVLIWFEMNYRLDDICIILISIDMISDENLNKKK